MFVFLAIALSIYGLVNFYIGRRGAQALASMPGARRVFLVLFIGLALVFPLGRVLMAVARGRAVLGPGRGRDFHMVVMLYGLLAVLAIDLVRLVNAFVPFLPKGLLAGREDGTCRLRGRGRGGRPDHRRGGLERDPAAPRSSST